LSDAKFKVLVASVHILKEHRKTLEELKKRLPSDCELVIPFPPNEDEILRLVSDVDVIFTSSASRNLIESAEKLKMIQVMGTGVDKIDIEAAAERGVIVCNSVGLNAIPVAEHAISLMLTLAKKITKYDKELRIGEWRRTPATLLHSKTLGIVGLGSIGVEVAKRAKAFDMRIIAIKRHPSEELRGKLGIDFLGGPDYLPHILKKSDFIVLSVVLTPETKNMIGESELRMMNRSSYLVNISRGDVINEEALVRALNEGVIAGAGLDVFEVEPVSSDNPLLKLENVVVTPHVAGGGGPEKLRKIRAEFAARNIEKIIRGQKPENIVDPVLKYSVNKSHL
jgi:phosphoglycerate dehydrogenase-like enzyme